MKIDKTTTGLICVQIHSSEASDLLGSLQELVDTHEPVVLSADHEEEIMFQLVDSGIAVDSRGGTAVRVKMGLKELADLKESIAEHIRDGGEWPLDYALEPLGATFLPESIRDLVIETIPDV